MEDKEYRYYQETRATLAAAGQLELDDLDAPFHLKPFYTGESDLAKYMVSSLAHPQNNLASLCPSLQLSPPNHSSLSPDAWRRGESCGSNRSMPQQCSIG